MVFIVQPKKEGEEKTCGCGAELVGRLTDYKGRFPDKLQWQDKESRKAHYDKEGNCKGQTPEQTEHDAGPTFFQKNTVETTTSASITTAETKEPQVRDYLEPAMKKIIADQTQQIIGIRSVVQTVCKDTLGNDTHPGMVWEMTALLYQKYFGGKKE